MSTALEQMERCTPRQELQFLEWNFRGILERDRDPPGKKDIKAEQFTSFTTRRHKLNTKASIQSKRISITIAGHTRRKHMYQFAVSSCELVSHAFPFVVRVLGFRIDTFRNENKKTSPSKYPAREGCSHFKCSS